MKQVYLARDPVDAELTAEALRAEDIEAVVRTDAVFTGAQPFPSVWVDEDDEDSALEILALRRQDP
jgi:hypothetical protein